MTLPTQESKKHNCLILGATGAIGSALAKELRLRGLTVWRMTRSVETNIDKYLLNMNEFLHNQHGLHDLLPKFSSVVFAQGVNSADQIANFNRETHKTVYNANVLITLDTVNILVSQNLLENPSSICIVSSIWQDIARNDKLSYSVSKSALKGVVLSLVADLSKSGVRINAVLPGPIDNAMTHSNLTPTQIYQFKSDSPCGDLPKLSSVVNAVIWLVTSPSEGITGNFIRVDSGASLVKIY